MKKRWLYPDRPDGVQIMPMGEKHSDGERYIWVL